MNLLKTTSLGWILLAAAAIGCQDEKSNEAANTNHDAAAAVPSAKASASAAASAAAAPSASAAEAVSPETAADEKLASDELFERHRYHHAGITTFISMSLDTIGVPKEKEAAVAKIQHELDTRLTPVREAEKNLHLKLAEGVAAGKVDAAKLTPELTKLDKAVETSRKDSAEAINQLHAALSPVERAALVEKVDAHWQVWKEANAERAEAKAAKEAAKGAKDDAKAAEGKPDEDHGRLAQLTKDLNLTPDQVEKIRAGIKAKAADDNGPFDPKVSKDVDTQLTAFTTAFNDEKFDAKTLASWDAIDSHLVQKGGDRLVHLCEVAAPILTPEQRTKWAEKIREREAEKKEHEGEKKAGKATP